MTKFTPVQSDPSAIFQATASGTWQWDVDRPEAFDVQWGNGESQDLGAAICDEDWRLLLGHLQQAVLGDERFRCSVALESGDGRIEHIELLGARAPQPTTGLRVVGLCWSHFDDESRDHQMQWAPLAKLSHELRSPLAAMSQQLRDAGSGCSDDEMRETLDSAHDSCTYMLSIIEDMLDAFRAGDQQTPRSPAKVDTSRLLGQLVPVARDRAVAKGLQLTVTQHEAFPSCFLAEPVALRRILQNLLDNAVKYTNAGSIQLHLELLGDDAGATLWFSVEDTGPGLTNQELAQVFQPFTRGTAGDKRSGGLGIGLALSQQLALTLDGRLEVHSEPGRGSRFSLSIPARVPESEAANAAGNAEIAVVAPGTRVLVVDDHQLLSKLTGHSLRRLGCDVQIATSAQQAIELLEVHTPQVIVLDLDLPDMSGCDLCRELAARESLADCRFVAYTGSSGFEGREQAEQAGFHAYFTKPATAEELLGT